MSRVILVGIDGSADSITALRWAIDYAVVLRAVVRTVHVSTPPGYVPWRKRHRAPKAPRMHGVAAAETLLSETPRHANGESVMVEHRLVEGTPGPVLADLARDADLLVVGATGKEWGTFFPVLSPGPTARHVMRRATCPVAVVRHAHLHSEPHRPEQEPVGATPAAFDPSDRTRTEASTPTPP